MAKVEVVNRQVIDGKEYKRGQVVDLSDGQARDLVTAGKVRPHGSSKPDVKPADAKAGK